MREGTRKLILLLFIFVGLSILNYPFLSQLVNMRSQSTVIQSYEDDVEGLSENEKEDMLAQAREYNRELAGMSAVSIEDPFSKTEQMDARYESLLNPDGSGIMGYVKIPSIRVSLPVYHGTSSRALEAGAGHLEGSSLPVGGESSHAVISAHNGLPSKLMFTDLDQLEVGEHFFLSVMGEELAYEVDQILTVKPEETEGLQIEAGQDYVTLLTCTPYGVNSHRYLVRGHRIPWEDSETDAVLTPGGKRSAGMLVLIVSVIVLAASAVILYLPKGKKRRPLGRGGPKKREAR